MSRTEEIANDISVLMPMIARRIFMEFFQTIDLTQTQIFTVMTLYEKTPTRLTDLSNKLGVAAPTITGIVDRLEKAGYVKRIPDKEDRRVINVDLTEKGIKLAKQLRATIKNKWQGMLAKLPHDDSENFLNILKKVQQSL